MIEEGDGYAAWHIDAGGEVAREHCLKGVF